MAVPAPQTVPQKTLPKVLRIGVVVDGKIAQERLIRAGEPVTVGDGPRNTFPYSGTGLGASHTLFVAQGGAYQLVAMESTEGKISWKDGIRDLSDLRAKGEMQKRGESWVLPLSENVRGKLTLKSVTILFQFVPAPPEPVRAVTAADFRPRLFNEDDPLFLGLLGVFNVIAVAFQLFIFLSPPPEDNALDHVDDALDLLVEKQPDQIKIEIPLPETPAEAKVEEKVETKTEAKAEEKAETKAPDAESVKQKSLILQMIGSNGAGESDRFVNDVLGDNAAQNGDLAAALDGVGNIQEASAENMGLKSGGEGGRDNAAVGITDAEGGKAGTGEGTVKVKKAKVDFTSDGDVTADEGDVGNVSRVVKANRGRIETCVQTSLKQNPAMAGRVSVGWVIQDGKTSNVKLVSNTTGDPALGDCVARAVRQFRFDAGLTATVDEYPWVVSGQ